MVPPVFASTRTRQTVHTRRVQFFLHQLQLNKTVKKRLGLRDHGAGAGLCRCRSRCVVGAEAGVCRWTSINNTRRFLGSSPRPSLCTPAWQPKPVGGRGFCKHTVPQKPGPLPPQRAQSGQQPPISPCTSLKTLLHGTPLSKWLFNELDPGGAGGVASSSTHAGAAAAPAPAPAARSSRPWTWPLLWGAGRSKSVLDGLRVVRPPQTQTWVFRDPWGRKGLSAGCAACQRSRSVGSRDRVSIVRE